jgi:hypothetical protein
MDSSTRSLTHALTHGLKHSLTHKRATSSFTGARIFTEAVCVRQCLTQRRGSSPAKQRICRNQTIQPPGDRSCLLRDGVAGQVDCLCQDSESSSFTCVGSSVRRDHCAASSYSRLLSSSSCTCVSSSVRRVHCAASSHSRLVSSCRWSALVRAYA